MSESSKAVFLSYASQDTEAAKRIADALRSAGVEVWFDQEGGLEHGDEWDAKIRRQIRECVLFIPLISANTQARHEGYFRIEWELAAQRALGIASGVPFILPVVIDGTREPDALVPDRFRTVQWTKLAGGNVPPDVLQRFLKLWSHRTGVLKYEAAQEKDFAGRPAPAVPAQARKFGTMAYVLGAVAVLFLGAVLYLALKPRRSPEEISRLVSAAQALAANVATKSAPDVPPPPPVAPLSDARQLANRARELYEALEGTRDDYKLAEELIGQAKAKDATDAEVCAAEAELHEHFILRGWDTSDARREAARAAAQRAIRLDPKSFEARLAQVGLLPYTGREGEEKVRVLRELRGERPTDQRVLRLLASTLGRQGHQEEANLFYDESAALPGGDPLALYSKSLACWFAGEPAEAESAIDASLAQKPFQSSLLMKAWYRMALHGDLDGARALINRIDSAELQEDRACFFSFYLEMLSRKPEAALARLDRLPRDWFSDNWYRGPKGELAGDAQQLAGRPGAATIEWQNALQLAEQQLKLYPKSMPTLITRVCLLARLGRRDEAARQFEVLRQMSHWTPGGNDPVPNWIPEVYLLLGRKEEAIQQIARNVKGQRRVVIFPAAVLRLDPMWDPLRNEPGFAELLAQPEAAQQGTTTAAASAPSSLLPAAARPAEADAKSVAVLAFANLSGDKDNEYFSDGISEELLTVLQKVPGLHVAARTSSFSFKGKNATAQEIGEKLGVANVVEGSVRRAGNTVRITVHLSRAATGEERWSESYTRELKDVFALQEQLALAIVGELRGQLVGGESAAVKAAVKGGTRVPEAYQQYLQGRFFVNRHSEKNIDQALGFFQRAVELDPDFALAWVGLARTHIWYCEFSTDVDRAGFEDHLAKARAAVDRALALEPALPESLLAKSEIQLNLDFDWKGAGESLRAARAQAPADPELLIAAGNLACALGDNAQGTAFYQQAVNVDPVSSRARSFLAYQFATTGRLAEAEAEYPRVLELNPDVPWAHAGLGMAYLLQGRFEEAANAAKGDAGEWAELLIVAAARWGQHRKANSDAALGRLVTMFADTAAYQIAAVYAYRGEKDAAFEWLARARRQRDGGIIGLQIDPLLNNLHSDPRWSAFLQELGLAPAPAS